MLRITQLRGQRLSFVISFSFTFSKCYCLQRTFGEYFLWLLSFLYYTEKENTSSKSVILSAP